MFRCLHIILRDFVILYDKVTIYKTEKFLKAVVTKNSIYSHQTFTLEALQTQVGPS